MSDHSRPAGATIVQSDVFQSPLQVEECRRRVAERTFAPAFLLRRSSPHRHVAWGRVDCDGFEVRRFGRDRISETINTQPTVWGRFTPRDGGTEVQLWVGVTAWRQILSIVLFLAVLAWLSWSFLQPPLAPAVFGVAIVAVVVGRWYGIKRDGEFFAQFFRTTLEA